MNILYVLPYFNPKRGGDVNVCANLAREFVKKGHEVTILTTDFEFDKDYLGSIEEHGINIVYSKVLFNVGLFIYSPEMKKWLNNNLQNFDIIHLHTFRAYQNNIIRKYSKKYNVPYILQAHGSVLPFFQKQKLKKIYDYIWGHSILNDASQIIALTETETEQYKEMKVPENKIEIIPNGITLSDYQDLPETGEFRSKYNISQDEKIILYLGRIHKRKGIDVLLKSFETVSKDFKNVRLVLVGPDDGFMDTSIKMLKKLKLESKVQFIGPLYNKDKLESYIDSDILIYPAVHEIFGLVPFEAIICGTPVIVTDDCGCGELIKTANCGFLVKYGNSNDLSIKIKYVIENPKEAYEKVQNGKNYLLNNLIWDNITKKVEKLYKNCLDE